MSSHRGGGRGGGGGGGGGRGGHRGPLPRDVQVSKKMSWLLRHGAEKENLTLDSRGFVNVEDFLNNRNLRSFKVTFEEMRQIVQENDKQRFSLVPVDSPNNGAGGEEVATANASHSNGQTPSNNPKDYLIRANQGHSLQLESSELLTPILPSTNQQGSLTAIHGTTHSAWPLILSSGGLKPMGRTHVHFAPGLPAGFKTVLDQDPNVASAPVISGMRNSSTVLIWVDVERAMDSGIKFWRSDNGVVLTEGNEDGVVPVEFFKRVEDRTGLGVLVEDGKVIKEAPAEWAKGKKE